MVEEAGFEPANSEEGRFTVQDYELMRKVRNQLQQVIQTTV